MKRIATTLAALFVVATAHAQIYQWKDASGKTVISDKPPAGQVKQTKKIDSAPSTTSSSPDAAPAAEPKSLADRDLEYRKRQKEAQDAAEKTRAEQKAAADKKEACDGARRALQTLESGERIALRDDKGERYYLEEAQREQEITRLRQNVQASCQ